MSAAIICGKRSFFEDIESSPGNSNSPTLVTGPVYKKFRCSSPARFNYSPPVQQRSLFDQLRGLFPDMETQLLEKALEESGNDLDSAIKKLEALRLGNTKYNSGSAVEETAPVEEGVTQTGVNVPPTEESQNNLRVDGADWVDLFVRQMMSATSIDDAKSRAANILESLEKSITARASETTQNYHKENVMLREQIEILLRENGILKRAVAIQHERQKEYDEKNQEGHHLKQMVSQYQEQIRNLEVLHIVNAFASSPAEQHHSWTFPPRCFLIKQCIVIKQWKAAITSISI